MSLGSNISEKANLIWAIADKLTGTYKPHEYSVNRALSTSASPERRRFLRE